MSGLKGNAKQRTIFNAKQITIKAQKNIACSFPNQTKRLFLNEITSRLVDNIHQLIWHYTQSKERADYIVKQFLKINIKLFIVAANGCLKKQQEEDMNECREVVKEAALCFIRHVRGPANLQKMSNLTKIQAAIKTAGALAQYVSEEHLTRKTVDKLTDVVSFFTTEEFLAAILSNQPPYSTLATEIAEDLQDSIDRGIL
ncbi:unnamed protein product [Mesocestoides corti]|uniref:Tumor necrosis factor alpha-induced protein 8-like protein n=1 Tax=Mesocestoides corti TaxID=53468 RepID=A0A0R3U473_MESCO|nr:unnamed protein product [Mesocestoides corti]